MKQKAFGVDQSTVFGLVLWGFILWHLESHFFFQYHVEVTSPPFHYYGSDSIGSQPLDDCAIVKGTAPGEPAVTRREVVFNVLKCTSVDLQKVIKRLEGWESTGSMNWMLRNQKVMEFYEAFQILERQMYPILNAQVQNMQELNISCPTYQSNGNIPRRKHQKRENGKIRKRSRIAIATVSALDNDARRVSLENKERYSIKHGYDFYYLNKIEFDIGRPLQWAKVPLLFSLLDRHEYIWFVDLDSMILDDGPRLEDFIDPNFDLIIAKDQNGINSGSFFIKSTDWSKLFLIFNWAEDRVHSNRYFWEQGTIMCAARNFDVSNHMKFVSQDLFNAYERYFRSNDKGLPFLLHFPGDLGKWDKVLDYGALLDQSNGDSERLDDMIRDYLASRHVEDDVNHSFDQSNSQNLDDYSSDY